MLVSYNMFVCILEFGWQRPDLDPTPHQAHMSDNDEVESLEASPVESLDGDSAAPGVKTDNGELPALDCKSKHEQKQAKYLQEAAKDQQKAARQERNTAREQQKAIREQQKAAREQQKAATEKLKAAAYKLKAEQRTIAADERAGPDCDSHPHIPEKCMATARQLFAALKARCAGMVMAVEIFAGCARLSGAMIEQSVSLFVPIDKNNGPWADISNPFVAAVLLFALEEGLFWYIHLGTECKMWSNARTRSSSACSLDVVSFTTAVLRGIKRCINRGHQVWFSIENPLSSKLFDLTCVKQLLDELSAIEVRYECCAWGATFQKASQLRTNFKPLAGLGKRCKDRWL